MLLVVPTDNTQKTKQVEVKEDVLFKNKVTLRSIVTEGDAQTRPMPYF